MEEYLAFLWKDLNVNLAVWGVFMNTTLRAAVHLGQDYEVNLTYVKNHLWNTAGQLFRKTEQLVRGQTETSGKSMINFQRFDVGIDKLLAQSSLSVLLTPKPMSSPTLYSVWERWETILLNPGRGKFNGIRTTIISAN